MNFLRSFFGNKSSEVQQQILKVRRDNPQLTANLSDDDIMVLLQQADQTQAGGEPMVFRTIRTNDARAGGMGAGLDIGPDHASIDDHIRLALMYEEQGRYDEAITILNKCLEISSSTGYQTGEMSSYCNLGIAYERLHNFPLAIEKYQKALDIVERIGDKPGINSIHCNLANVYKHMGKFELAENHYLQALQISEQSGDRYSEAIDNFNLGQLCRETGKIHLACTHLRNAQKLFELAGDQEKAQFTSRVLQSM